jgi:hypothetical protein
MLHEQKQRASCPQEAQLGCVVPSILGHGLQSGTTLRRFLPILLPSRRRSVQVAPCDSHGFIATGVDHGCVDLGCVDLGCVEDPVVPVTEEDLVPVPIVVSEVW